jgi:adhesin/invasin
LVAGGSGTASVTATLDDSLGNPVSGQVINFSESGNPTSSSCGILSSMSGTTMANGTVTETYTAASSFGNCVITVSTSATPMTAAVAIAQTPVAPSSTYIVNLAANPSSVPADGVSTSTINVTVRDSNGLPVQDDPINLITTGTCGQSSVQVGMTDAMGSFDTTYTASNVVGSCTVTVTEALSGLTTNTTINQTAPTPVLSLTLTPASVPASASSTSTVGISVNSVNGPIAGDAILLTTSGASCGSLSTTSTSTNQWGEATVLYTATTSVGVCVISAIENSANQGSSANLIQTNGQPSSWYAVSVAASPTSINGDGSSTSAVTVTVANGSSAVSGDAVVLSVSGGSNCGTLNPTQGTTNSAGQITSTYTAGKMNANCTIVATESVTGASGFGSITQLPSITITAVLNGSSPALPLAKVEVGGKYYPLTITIKNALGGPVANAPIQLTAISLTSGVCGTFGYSGAAGISGAVTDVNGQYETVYTPTTSVGYCAFLISSGSTSGQLLAISSDKASSAPSNTVTVYTSPPVIANNGTSTTTVTEFVTNADGLPVANDPAIMIGPSLSSILGGSSCGQIVGNLAGVLPGSTNANGQFTATYQSSTTAKTCIVLASEADTVTGAGGLIVQTASVPTLGTISFSYGSLVIPAGGSTQVITVTLSSNSKPVEGDSISMVSVQPVESGACGTYYQYSNLTNSSGQALIYYLPSSTVGFCIVQISESYTNTSSTFVIDQSEPGATSAFSVIGNLNGSNLTVSVTDSNGIGVQSDPVLVTLSGSGNACSGAAIANNGAGTTGNAPLGSVSFSLTLPSGSGCSADIMEADTGATTSVPI